MSETLSYKFTAKMFADIENQCIWEEQTSPTMQAMKKIADLRETQVRRNLIALGWTPPEREILDCPVEERLLACVKACDGVPTIALRGYRIAEVMNRNKGTTK